MNGFSVPIAALATAALLTLAACGGDGDAGSTPGNDITPPAVTLTEPANFAAGLVGTINLSASATDNIAVTSVEMQVDGVPVGGTLVNAPYTVPLDTTAYASGQHIVRTRARDAAGNISAWASATVQFGGSRTQPAGFTRNETWSSGLSSATAFAQAPDGRWFVAEQGGTLRIVNSGGAAPLATAFITLTVDSTQERGLIGVTLHPGFATNRYVYLYYTTTEGGTHNRISRYTANPTNPNIVSAGSEVRIADLPLLGATNHNGGAMHFGADGKLYVAVGENAVPANAQDLSTPLGKMLRFNDDGSIPADNPFCTTTATLRCAIWAYGLRNPYTFAVQPGTGRIHINDVGASTWEEVNLSAKGANYGWPNTEGPTAAAGVTGPLFAYKHSPATPAETGFFTGCAISGGAFYPSTGGTFPAAYGGTYFFADYCGAFIARLDVANGSAAYSFGSVPGSPVDMLVGLDGALYVLTRSGISRFSAP